jgi:hypothetical protein
VFITIEPVLINCQTNGHYDCSKQFHHAPNAPLPMWLLLVLPCSRTLYGVA